MSSNRAPAPLLPLPLLTTRMRWAPAARSRRGAGSWPSRPRRSRRGRDPPKRRGAGSGVHRRRVHCLGPGPAGSAKSTTGSRAGPRVELGCRLPMGGDVPGWVNEVVDPRPPSTAVRPGDVLAGKYRVERVLGTGGMGMVVGATHLALGGRVALEFLLAQVLEGGEARASFARRGSPPGSGARTSSLCTTWGSLLTAVRTCHGAAGW